MVKKKDSGKLARLCSRDVLWLIPAVNIPYYNVVDAVSKQVMYARSVMKC